MPARLGGGASIPWLRSIWGGALGIGNINKE